MSIIEPTGGKADGPSADRRPVDPTPIIQLVVIERNGEEVSAAGDSSELGKRKSLRRPDSGQSGMSFMQSRQLISCNNVPS